jgi:uncharacterized membrane protein (DUF485 family)
MEKRSVKLETLLSKVVEFNKNVNDDIEHIKGFLYHDTHGYYIKIIDVISGSQSNGNEFRLSTSDEEFILHAPKPKLMVVDAKSWRYRFVKYVLGDNAPTPKTMQNGCPFFWLFMFSLLAAPFKFLIVLILDAIMLLPKGLEIVFDYQIDRWIENHKEEEIYDFYDGNVKIPFSMKKRYKYSSARINVIEKYICDTYNVSSGSKEYSEIKNYMREKYRAWSIAKDNLHYENQHKLTTKRLEISEKNREAKLKWEKRFMPLTSLFANAISSINEAIDEAKSWKNLIKRTKQIVGAIITLSLLFVAYFILSTLILFFITMIDLIILEWVIFTAVLITLLVCGIAFYLSIIVRGWLSNLLDTYRRGKKIWYIEPFVWTIYYPIKYFVLGIWYTILYLLITPIIFIFYKVIFKNILIPIGRFFVGAFNAILGNTGIFGEYFSASYSDYCPGIEWTGFEEEKEEE